MKTTIILIILIVVGVGYWLGSPLFFDKKVNEEFPIMQINSSEIRPSTVAEGTFVGSDSVHQGSGDMRILETAEGYVIRFEDNFEVTNGPDLYIGFGKDGEYKKGSEIARLKGNIGSQNYLVPSNINLEDYNEVWIWCRAFSVPFAKASFAVD